MHTETTIRRYFDALSSGQDWSALMAEAMTFTSHGTPAKHIEGRDACMASTRGFYSMIRKVHLRQLIVDDDRACALVRYELQPPHSEPFISDVAEIFSARNGLIESFEIYFDSAPFAART